MSPDENSYGALCECLVLRVSYTHMTAQLVTSLLTPTQTHQWPYCLSQPQLWTHRQGQRRRRVDVAHRSTFPTSPENKGRHSDTSGMKANLNVLDTFKLWEE